MQESSICHVIECNAYDLPKILRGFQQICTTTASRIFSSSEDCPKRLFPSWECVKLSLAKETDVDIESEFSDFATAGFASLSKLIEIGKDLKAKSGESIEIRQYLRKNHSIHLASNLRAVAMSKCDGFFTISEYLSEFYEVPNVYLDSEVSWPMDTNFTPSFLE